jgi:hypothetical protein
MARTTVKTRRDAFRVMRWTVIQAFNCNDQKINEWCQRIHPGITVESTREEKLKMVVLNIIERSSFGITGEIA